MIRAIGSHAFRSRIAAAVVGFSFVLVVASGAVAPSSETSSGGPSPNIASVPDGSAVTSSAPSVVASPSQRPTPAARVTPRPDPTAVLSSPVGSPSEAAEPTPGFDPPALPGPFVIDLYEKGDFVSQATKAFCVPASMQTMINIIDVGADRRSSKQEAFYALARDLSTDRLRGDGASPKAGRVRSTSSATDPTRWMKRQASELP